MGESRRGQTRGRSVRKRQERIKVSVQWMSMQMGVMKALRI